MSEAPKTLGGLEVVALPMSCPACESTEFFALVGERELVARCLSCGATFQGSVRPSTVVRRGEPLP